MNPTFRGKIDCSRRRVRPPTLAPHRSSMGVFHWQHLGPTAWLWRATGLPCVEGLPDLLERIESRNAIV